MHLGRFPRIALSASAAAALVLALPLGAGAAALPVTIRTSVATDGTQGNMMSGRFSPPDISGDARFTAFDSIATNLVEPDANGDDADVFVHDSVTGVTERVSASTAGVQGNDDSQFPVLDAHGRIVAFDSDASNLAPNDPNGTRDVFVHNRTTGQTGLVSVAMNGGPGNDSSFGASISGNGRFVAFVSDASNLVPDDTEFSRDVFVRDLVMGTTEMVSLSSEGEQGNSSSAPPTISADGNVVAFGSFASNLVSDDTNGHFDAFARNRATGTTVRVSEATDGTQGDQPSTNASVSGNGRFVAFQSDATTLVANDTNNRSDAFVHDLLTSRTIRVSVTNEEGQANGDSIGPGIRGGSSFPPGISFSGTRVTFDSVATNLVAGDTNTCEPSFPLPGQCPDVFVRDWMSGTTVRVSVATDGSQANDASTDPAMDYSGRAVAFFSAASNLVPGDTNVCPQFPTPGHCTDIFEHIGAA